MAPMLSRPMCHPRLGNKVQRTSKVRCTWTPCSDAKEPLIAISGSRHFLLGLDRVQPAVAFQAKSGDLALVLSPSKESPQSNFGSTWAGKTSPATRQ